jgi:FMN reductase
MLNVVTIAGCPSLTSRSTAILHQMRKWLERAAVSTSEVSVRQLPADDLLLGRAYNTSIRQSCNLVKAAAGVIIATPICQTAYSGGLKAFLDMLPADALDGKLVLPIATGPSPASALAIDYTLRPVLAALGARHILDSVYVLDKQVQLTDRQVWFDDAAHQRLQRALHRFISELAQKPVVSMPTWIMADPRVAASA